MAFAEIAGMILRAAELAFAAIVAGINGSYLHDMGRLNVDSWYLARFIYAEVVAGISIFFALIWLIPFPGSFIHYPIDILVSVLWFPVFGLIVNYLDGTCGWVFNWVDVTVLGNDLCRYRKTVIAFSFLSAICWLASAIVDIIWVRDRTTRRYERRRWRTSRV
ncbi:integral membrane protein [Microdochium bolleyi]|uniref:Integral membrane protein n=1 Tax=Microdochium bolleyi TaxID=196109 RepID=A0A136JCQ0_9PEZI|nr:integral membrane protein [Microdochium bolleyi]